MRGPAGDSIPVDLVTPNLAILIVVSNFDPRRAFASLHGKPTRGVVFSGVAGIVPTP